MHYSMLHYSGKPPALSTLSKHPGRRVVTQSRARAACWQRVAGNTKGAPPTGDGDPTTNFLTAATLIYAIGAGITTAARTRLALQ